MHVDSFLLKCSAWLALSALAYPALAAPPVCKSEANKPFRTLTVNAAPTEWLRGLIPIRELQDVSGYVTDPARDGSLIARLQGKGGTCPRKLIVFPACSTLEIKQSGGDVVMSLFDTSSSPIKTLVDAKKVAPVSMTHTGVDFLQLDHWHDAQNNDIAIFVYLLDEASNASGKPGSAEINKHFLLEAFDNNDTVCAAERPDKEGNLKPSQSKLPIRYQQTDTTQGHEGKP